MPLPHVVTLRFPAQALFTLILRFGETCVVHAANPCRVSAWKVSIQVRIELAGFCNPEGYTGKSVSLTIESFEFICYILEG